MSYYHAPSHNTIYTIIWEFVRRGQTIQRTLVVRSLRSHARSHGGRSIHRLQTIATARGLPIVISAVRFLVRRTFSFTSPRSQKCSRESLRARVLQPPCWSPPSVTSLLHRSIDRSASLTFHARSYVLASPALPSLARFPLLPRAADPLRTANHVGIGTVRPSPARSSFPTGRGTRARRDLARVHPHRTLPIRACRHRLARGRADGTAAGRRGPRQDPLNLALPHLRDRKSVV